MAYGDKARDQMADEIEDGYPDCPKCQRYVEAAFRDAIEFSKFRTMLKIADDRITAAYSRGIEDAARVAKEHVASEEHLRDLARECDDEDDVKAHQAEIWAAKSIYAAIRLLTKETDSEKSLSL